MIDKLKSWFTTTDSKPDQEMIAADMQRSFSNPQLGYGGENDVVANTKVTLPRHLYPRTLESLYVNTWVAAKVVDLIVDDVFSPGIIWGGEDEAKMELMQGVFDDMQVINKVSGAVKAARLYGSSILIFAPKDGDFENPLDPENVRQDEISHLLVVHKEELEIYQTYADPREPKYGEPYTYRWNIQTEGKVPIEERVNLDFPNQLIIHSSRCLRFDGIKPNTDVGWLYGTTLDDKRWGLSILTRIYDDLILDLIMNAGGGELVKRASVPVIKMADFRNVLAMGAVGDQITPERYAQTISANINSAKVLFMDAADDVASLDTSTTGVQGLLENQTSRLAMIAGVPITRFKGESATGLSATGNGDARDWRISVESYRKDAIETQWEKLMLVLSRNAGLSEPPEWEWGMLGEMDSAEQSTIAKTLMETATKLVESEIISVDEAREYLNQSELFELPDDWVPPEPQEIMLPPTDDQMNQ